MPHVDQTNNGVSAAVTHHSSDQQKSSTVLDKSSLKPLDLRDYSPSQEEDPNFSYEKDKSAVEVMSVVEKFLKPTESALDRMLPNYGVKTFFSDMPHSVFMEDFIRKRKSSLLDCTDKKAEHTANGQNSVKPEDKNDKKSLNLNGDYHKSTNEANGKSFVVSTEAKTTTPIEEKTRKSSLTEINGRTGKPHDINGHKTEKSDLEKKLLESPCITDKAVMDSTSEIELIKDQSLEEEEEVTLLQWEDMPRHLQFNPYVKTGYRPLLSTWGCLHSLLYLHNETVNILTHGLPIFYIIYVVPKLLPWEAGAGFPFLAWCHLAGALAPWCGSFMYHLFMNTSRGPYAYNRLLQLDMLGIWVSQSFGALPMMTATTFCMPWYARWTLLTAYCVLSLWGLYKALTAWSPWERRLCFLLPFTMRAILAWCRAGGMAGGHPEAIHHIILQDAVSAIGGVIGAINIPERWFPGTVDFCMNSHNIMHVLVVTAVYFMHKATVLDIRWMSEVQCYATTDETASVSVDEFLPNVIYQL